MMPKNLYEFKDPYRSQKWSLEQKIPGEPKDIRLRQNLIESKNPNQNRRLLLKKFVLTKIKNTKSEIFIKSKDLT